MQQQLAAKPQSATLLIKYWSMDTLKNMGTKNWMGKGVLQFLGKR